jgi:hypothetical protein
MALDEALTLQRDYFLWNIDEVTCHSDTRVSPWFGVESGPLTQGLKKKGTNSYAYLD